MSAENASRDLYQVLGVAKTASQDEIKKAYRTLARDNHPDAHPGDKQAENRFKDVSQAYAVLSDPVKRKKYDEQRDMSARFATAGAGGPSGAGGFGGFGAPSGFGAGASQMDFDLSDLLGGMFGDRRGSGRTRGGPTPGRRGEDLQSETSISFEQAIDGAAISLSLSGETACPTCHGTGAAPGTSPQVCIKCHGSGMQTATTGGVFSMTQTCTQCGGRGMVVETPCPICQGRGRTRGTRTVNVRIPAGVKDGQRIRIPGKGGAGVHGGPAGDLFVMVHVADHPIFGRRGNDLTVDVPVEFDDLVLGANVSVPSLKGEPVTLKIPPGTPSGRIFRVRGHGAKSRSGTGDLMATVVIHVPTQLNDDQRAAIEAYRQARDTRNAAA